VQNSIDYIAKDKFASLLGIELVQRNQDHAVVEMAISAAHTNGLGGVHGAVMFALADIAFACACNQQQTAIGVQADIRYLQKNQGNKLTAEAELVSASNKFGTYRVSVRDETHTLIASFTGMAYRLPS